MELVNAKLPLKWGSAFAIKSYCSVHGSLMPHNSCFLKALSNAESQNMSLLSQGEIATQFPETSFKTNETWVTLRRVKCRH